MSPQRFTICSTNDTAESTLVVSSAKQIGEYLSINSLPFAPDIGALIRACWFDEIICGWKISSVSTCQLFDNT
jgi:hypothetical protein